MLILDSALSEATMPCRLGILNTFSVIFPVDDGLEGYDPIVSGGASVLTDMAFPRAGLYYECARPECT
jgi:hypothetical protein